jgi:Raf kinase inhibitor-like YbhB/YbcL family protein
MTSHKKLRFLYPNIISGKSPLVRNLASLAALAALFYTIQAHSAPLAQLKVTSKAFHKNGKLSEANVYHGFGCQGANFSPDLEWSRAPKGTKSFAVTVFDPDAPTGVGWWHWLTINIPSSVTSLKHGASGTDQMPEGSVEVKTDYGKAGYGGPCPPAGSRPHRYIFKVYALKDKLPIDVNGTGAMVAFYINQLKIAEGSVTATYSRK